MIIMRKAYKKYIVIIVILLTLIYLLAPQSFCSEGIGEDNNSSEGQSNLACLLK